MTNKDKAVAVIRRLRTLINEGHSVTFTHDMGDGLTVCIDDQHFHTYNGKTRNDEEIIEYLYDNMKYPIYDETEGNS